MSLQRTRGTRHGPCRARRAPVSARTAELGRQTASQRDDKGHTLCYLLAVKRFNWNDGKNERLRAERGITIEEILFHIENGDLLDVLEHPNADRYPEQRILVVGVNDYAYLVPYVEDDRELFLKTFIPSRSATKQYIGK